MTNAIAPCAKTSKQTGTAREFSKREFGAVLAAIRSHPNAEDLNDLTSLILSTALIPEVISGIRWEDIDLAERRMLVRSASPHSTAVSLDQPLLRTLQNRRQKHPNDEYLLDSACLREAAVVLSALSREACGREATPNDVRKGTLKGWVRCSGS